MTTKTEAPHYDTRLKIMALLRRAEGEPLSIQLIASKTKIGAAAVRHVAELMVSAGSVRQTKSSKQTICYYVPTERQLAVEEKARQAVVHKPLQPRTAHAEAVARARAVRDQIRSIG